MRIADKMSYNQVNRSISKNRSEMNRLQGEAASQKRVNRPSDDPVASHRILAARTELQGIDQYSKNISSARTFLEYSDQALGELTDVLIRVKELAIGQASDGGSNQESRQAVAAEVEQLRWQAMQVGNRKMGDRYIFGGHKTDRMPFGEQGKYQGDNGDIKIQIDKDSFLAMNIPGNKVFLGEGVSRDGAIRSDQNTPTDLKEIKEYKKEEARKNQNWDEVDRLNHEDKDPQAVDGLFRDLASEPRTVPEDENNGTNVFQVIQNFEVSLMTGDKSGIQEAIDEVDSALTQVINARSQVGARVTSLDRTMESMQKAKVDNITTKSEMEDVDMFQVLSDINKTESALQATLQTSGKMIQPSLMDFLR